MATLVETAPCFHRRLGRTMTRCECAELPFEEIARRIREDGQSLREMCARTGCGQTCTACLPDLEEYLARPGR